MAAGSPRRAWVAERQPAAPRCQPAGPRAVLARRRRACLYSSAHRLACAPTERAAFSYHTGAPWHCPCDTAFTKTLGAAGAAGGRRGRGHLRVSRQSSRRAVIRTRRSAGATLLSPRRTARSSGRFAPMFSPHPVACRPCSHPGKVPSSVSFSSLIQGNNLKAITGKTI